MTDYDDVTCSRCLQPFTAEEWEARHTDPANGEDCHERCCPRCRYEKKRKVSPPGSFRNARGVLPWKEGDELPEDAIRRLRESEEK